MTEPTVPRDFAASNSCRGFCNYYGDLFTCGERFTTGERLTDGLVDRLYIIKGGPGTGKSHFMKVVARHARAVGYCVTEYACSSDPDSLDGLLLSREGCPSLGFLDGTAPHVREPILPGVKEEIINLGQFWNSRLLAGQSDTVRALTAGKSSAYGRAYAYLAACGEVDRAVESLMDGCACGDRLSALADRILRHQPKGEGFSAVPALRRAVGMKGQVCLHSYERETAQNGGTLLIAEDYYGLGYRLTRALFERSRREGHRLRVSYDPVYPHKIDGLCYSDSGLCVLVGHAEPPEECAVRTISLRRYADPTILKDIRGELRHGYALRDRLLESALRELAVVSAFHFDLETIYSSVMDFAKKEAFTEGFCRSLFGEGE